MGTGVDRADIHRIEPSPDVTQAMHRQMKAERERRAVVTEAEGDRTARITKAEGLKQAVILEAEGQAEAIRKVADADRYKKEVVAEGEGRAIERVYGAIHTGNPTPDLLAIKYMEARQGIANGRATKVFLPPDPTAGGAWSTSTGG